MPYWMRRHVAALRALIVLTAVTGVVYPLVVTGIAQALFHDRADGSVVRAGGRETGSALIGQPFTDARGRPIERYFQSRPSAAAYDPAATTASNLGPEDVVDVLPAPGREGRRSLLTQVCARSRAAGALEGVSGARPFCTADGVGAVLKVFPFSGTPARVVSVNQACPAVPFASVYRGVRVECARPGADYSAGRTVPVRGTATAVVPPDAVTASGSGLDPGISVAYAELQAPRVARARGLPLGRVRALIEEHTTGRTLGFMGEPTVDVLALNLALDASR